MPVAALVLGILSTICSLTVLLWPVGVSLGVVALILGIAGRKTAAANHQPTGLATAGVALGGVGIGLGILLFVACAVYRPGGDGSKVRHERQDSIPRSS
jgi:hypothetical protein